MNELISIIVPVYNVADYLPECIESLLSQTYSALEIILVDDGSQDGSGQICDEWAEKDPRIKVIHQENLGVSKARNAALRICTGKMIGFMDADDWCTGDMYQTLANTMNEETADVVACGFVDYPYGPDIPVKKGIVPTQTCGMENAVVAMMQRNGYFTAIWNKLFRREVLFPGGELIEMDSTLSFGEDEVWLLEVLRNCDRIAFVPEAMYYWRLRQGSITRTRKVTEKQMSILEAKKRTLEILPAVEPLYTLARGRIFNDCYILKVQTYCTKDRIKYRLVTSFLRPMRKYWMRSKNDPFLRKAKILLLEIGMWMHCPVCLIDYINRKQRK